MISTPLPRLRVVCLAAMLLVFTACDVINPDETVILTPSFTYDFAFNVEEGDGTLRAESTNAPSISQLLERTFRADEVISATVTSAQLERSLPPGRALNTIFDTATLDLVNGTSVTVAAMSSPPGSRSGSMSVNSPDITGLFQGDDIPAALELDFITDEQEQYAFTANVRFRIEVEGV